MKEEYYRGKIHIEPYSNGSPPDVWLRDENVTYTPFYMFEEFKNKDVEILIREIDEKEANAMMYETMREVLLG